MADEHSDPPIRPARPPSEPPARAPAAPVEPHSITAIAGRDVVMARGDVTVTNTNDRHPAQAGQATGPGPPRIPVSEIVQAVSATAGVLLAGLALGWSVLRTAALLVAAVSGITAGYGWRLRGPVARRWIVLPALLCAACVAAFALSFLPAVT